MNTKKVNKTSNFLKIWFASLGSTTLILMFQLYGILALGGEESISETVSELGFIVLAYLTIGAIVSLVFAVSYQLLINKKPTKKILISTFIVSFLPHLSNFAFDVVPFDFIVLMFVLIAIIVSIIQYSILREDREISDASIDKSTLVNTPH